MQRTIKSFVMRGGRITKRQQHALDYLLPAYEMPFDKQTPIPLSAPFAQEAETIVEIGFGMGHSLIAMAKQQTQRNFIGIEVHQAGIGSLVANLHEEKVNNVRVAMMDAVEVFNHYITNNSLAGVQIFFPDPWPKKRHHKRRLIQPEFIQLVASRLKKGGFIHCATDWQNYAEHMLEVLSADPLLQNSQALGGYAPRPETRPLTKFEQRGNRLGHGVWDLIFTRKPGVLL